MKKQKQNIKKKKNVHFQNDEELDDEEMQAALREFGFDDVFNIKDDTFNAQKIYDDEKLEEKPLEFNFGQQTIINDKEYEEVQIKENNIEYKNSIFNSNQQKEKQEEKQQSQKKIERKQNINQKQQLQVNVELNNILLNQLNQLSETNILNPVKEFIHYQKDTYFHLAQLINQLDESSVCLIPVISAFIYGCKAYFTTSNYQFLLQQLITSNNQIIFQILAFCVYFNAISPQILLDLLCQTPQKLTTVLKIYRICGLQLNKINKQFKMNFDEEDEEIKQIQMQLFEDIKKEKTESTIFKQSYMIVLLNTVQDMKKQINLDGKRMELESVNEDDLQKLLNIQHKEEKIQINIHSKELLDKYQLNYNFLPLVDLLLNQTLPQQTILQKLSFLFEQNQTIKQQMNIITRFLFDYCINQESFSFFYVQIFRIINQNFNIIIQTTFWDFQQQIDQYSTTQIVNAAMIASSLTNNFKLIKVDKMQKKNILFIDLFFGLILNNCVNPEFKKTNPIKVDQLYKIYYKQNSYLNSMFQRWKEDTKWKNKIELICGKLE